MGLSHEKESDFILEAERASNRQIPTQAVFCFVFKVDILMRYLGHLGAPIHHSISNLAITNLLAVPVHSTNQTVPYALRGFLLS